ncbi:MAG: hypothetical protein AB7F86_15790 [Bdellovibrionales bacterium]
MKAYFIAFSVAASMWTPGSFAIGCFEFQGQEICAEPNQPLRKITCGNEDYSVMIDVNFYGSRAETVSWKQARSAPAVEYKVVSSTSGRSLWPILSNHNSTGFPIGRYIGQYEKETVVVDITRMATKGGGGYSYEGVLSLIRAQGAPLTWGIYCN